MPAEALTAVVLQSATAVAAAYGAWRCLALQKYASDRRLRALAWFFALFAVSLVAGAVWSAQVGGLEAGGPPPPDGRELRRLLGEPRGEEGATAFLLLQHLAMLTSLGVAVVAFGRRTRAPDATEAAAGAGPLLALTGVTAVAALGVAELGRLVPVALAIEASLTLYLAMRAMLNHVERKSPGALKAALGFALFFLGHLMFFLQHTPGQSRQPIGDILALVGIVLLIEVLPGRR